MPCQHTPCSIRTPMSRKPPLCLAAHDTQVSEMIKAAADDRQREEQRRLLLHQLHQLCRFMQQPHLQRPEEQMAAVVAHIKQVRVASGHMQLRQTPKALCDLHHARCVVQAYCTLPAKTSRMLCRCADTWYEVCEGNMHVNACQHTPLGICCDRRTACGT